MTEIEKLALEAVNAFLEMNLRKWESDQDQALDEEIRFNKAMGNLKKAFPDGSVKEPEPH